MTLTSVAAREKKRRDFLAARGWGDARVTALEPDASFRRYYRLQSGPRRAILMDAPPPNENAAAFATVTNYFATLGARVPEIYADELVDGLLIIEDLGDNTFSKLIANGADETALYRRAVDALVGIAESFGATATTFDLPHYDFTRAFAEAELLLDWYLPARLRRATAAQARKQFAQLWRAMLADLPPLAPTLVARDYHADNLMLVGDDCALLDYQDALIGSPAYDLVSLLEDARRDIAAPLAENMTRHYLNRRNQTGGKHTIAHDALRLHCLVWGAQRHCKVAGIFTRLWLRDGKDVYLNHLPRVLNLLRRGLNEPVLHPLRDWLTMHLGEVRHIPFARPPAELLRHCGS